MNHTLTFKNANKMISDKIIKKMRIEDLRRFYSVNKQYMTVPERRRYENTFFNKSSGHEFLLSRKGNKLQFIDIDLK